MEGSWGDEAELVASPEQAVARLRNPGGDVPAAGDIVLVSGGDIGDALLTHWRDEAGIAVEVITR